MALGIVPFIELKMKTTNSKKKITTINIIKYVIQQRQKVYDSHIAMKKLIDDIFRSNQDETSIKWDSFQKSILFQEVSSQRLGWFSWKKLKIVTQPSLSEVEIQLKQIFRSAIDRLYKQNEISSFKNKIQVVEVSESIFQRYLSFIDRFLFHQFLSVMAIILILNQFHFYLSENNFMTFIVSIFKETNNMVLVNQERGNLVRDYQFLNERVPNHLVLGIIKVDLREVKEQYLQAIRGYKKVIDQAVVERLGQVVDENSKLELQIQDSLNESPTSVGKYIEMIEYIKSRELASNLSKIKTNCQLSNKINETITKFQIIVADGLFFKYLGQLSLLQQIDQSKKQTLKLLNSSKDHFKKLVDESSDYIKRRFKKVSEDIREFVNEVSLEKANANLMVAKAIEEQLVEIISKGKQVNEQEQYLGYTPTSFLQCEQELKKFQKYSDLWELAEKIRYKLESWQNTPFLQIDVFEMIENSRECAYQLLVIQQQFNMSGMAKEQLNQFIQIINQMIDNIKGYENYFQTLLVLKEVSSREKYYQKVMGKLFNATDLIEIQQITIPDLIERNLESQSDLILELSLTAKKEQQITQKMAEFDIQLKEIQFKTYTLDVEDGVQLQVIYNQIQITNVLKEIQLEMQNFNMMQTTFMGQLEHVKERIVFLYLSSQYICQLLKKIFFIQEKLTDLSGYYKNIVKVYSQQNEFFRLKDEQKRRIDNLKRLGMHYFMQIFDRGEADVQANFESEELRLLNQKLDEQLQLTDSLLINVKEYIQKLQDPSSFLSLIKQEQVARFVCNMYSEHELRDLLTAVFPNIKSFNLTISLTDVSIQSFQSWYDEEIYLNQEITFSWKDQDLKNLFNDISYAYTQALQANINQYIPIVIDCKYNLNKVFKFIQQHTLYFQSLYVILQLHFYHDLTLSLYHSYIASESMQEFQAFLSDQLEFFMRAQSQKTKTSQMYYQLVLLIKGFIDILDYFNQQEVSSDSFMKSRSIQSFEFLSLPKISLDQSALQHKSVYFLKKTIEEFEKEQLGMEKDSPMLKEEHNDMSIFFKTLLPDANIALISMNNKQFYGYELTKCCECIALTPQMQRMYILMLQTFRMQCAAILAGPHSVGKRYTIEVKNIQTVILLQYLSCILAKRVTIINLDHPNNYASLCSQIGAALTQGIWAIVYADSIHYKALQTLSGIVRQFLINKQFFEIRSKMATGKPAILNGLSYSIDLQFKLLGTFSNNCKVLTFPSNFSIITFYRMDTIFLVKSLTLLITPTLSSTRLLNFWTFVNNSFKMIGANDLQLPDLPIVLQNVISRLKYYLASSESVKPMQIVREFLEVSGNRLPIEYKKLLCCFVDDEFKEDRLTEERNLLLKQEAEFAKEFIPTNQKILAHLSAFLDQYFLTKQILLIGQGSDKRLILDLAAYVHSRKKNFEFLKIYFPMNVLSDEDFKELMKNLLISQNSLIIEENQTTPESNKKKLIPSQVICYPSKGKRINHFSTDDWIILEDVSESQARIKQENTFHLTESISEWAPNTLSTTLPIIYIGECQSAGDIFLKFLDKLSKKHKFFASLEKHLKMLFYFFFEENQAQNFLPILEVLLNEFRKKQIANGFFTYKDFKPEERKNIFDPSSLQLASTLKQELVSQDHEIFGRNDERIKSVTEGIFTYSYIVSQGYQKNKLLESIDNYQLCLRERNMNKGMDTVEFGVNFHEQLSANMVFDLSSERWVQQVSFNGGQYLLYQKSLKSNLLSAGETVRLNPNAMNIPQVRGQFQQEMDLITNSKDKDMSERDYMVMLMMTARKNIVCVNRSLKWAKEWLLRRHSNRVIQLKYSCSQFKETILRKANLLRQYAVGLENKTQKTFLIVDDVSLGGEHEAFLNCLLNHNATYHNKEAVFLKKFSCTLQTNSSQFPTFKNFFIFSNDNDNCLELVSIYNKTSQRLFGPNEQLSTILISYGLGQRALNFNGSNFLDVCIKSKVFEGGDILSMATKFIILFKSLYEIGQQDQKEEQAFRKQLQYISLLHRTKDSAIRRLLSSEDSVDITFIESVRSVKILNQNQFARLLLQNTFGSFVAWDILDEIFFINNTSISVDFKKWLDDEPEIDFKENDCPIEQIIERFNPYIRLDKTQTQRMLAMNETSLQNILQQIMIAIQLKVNEVINLPDSITFSEVQGIFEIVRQMKRFDMMILKGSINYAQQMKICSFILDQSLYHKILVVEVIDDDQINKIMEVVMNPVAFETNDINTIEGPDTSSYEQMMNDFLSEIDIQVLLYKSEKIQLNQPSNFFSVHIILNNQNNIPIFNYYKDRALFSQSNPEYDQLIESYVSNLNEQIPTIQRMKELIYRLFYQVSNYFNEIEMKYYKESSFQHLINLFHEKIKIFTSSKDKQANQFIQIIRLIEESNILQEEQKKVITDKKLVEKTIQEQQQEITISQQQLDSTKIQLDGFTSTNDQSLLLIQSNLKSSIQTLMTIPLSKMMDELSQFAVSNDNIFLYQEFFCFFSQTDRKLEKIKNSDHFIYIKSLRHNEFLQLFSTDDIYNRLQNIISIQFLSLPRDIREHFLTLTEYSQLKQFVPNLKTITMIQEITTLFYQLIQQDGQQQISNLQEQIANLKENLKKIQLDMRITRDSLVHLDKKLSAYQIQMESQVQRSNRLQQHINQFNTLINQLLSLESSFQATHYFIDFSLKQSICFQIAIYIATGKYSQLNNIICMLLNQDKYFYHTLVRQFKGLDNKMIEQISLISFLTKSKIGLAIVQDKSEISMKYLLQKEDVMISKKNSIKKVCFCEGTLSDDELLTALKYGQIIIIKDPNDASFDILCKVFQNSLKYIQKNCFMTKKDIVGTSIQPARRLQMQKSKSIQTNQIMIENSNNLKFSFHDKVVDVHENFSIVIFLVNRKSLNLPSEIQHQFLLLSLNNDLIEAWTQRLCHIFIQNFRSQDAIRIINQHLEEKEKYSAAQDLKIQMIISFLQKADPLSDEYVLPLYKLTFEEFSLNYQQFLNKLSEEKEENIRLFVESGYYEQTFVKKQFKKNSNIQKSNYKFSVQTIKEQDENESLSDEEDGSEISKNPEDSIESASSNDSQPQEITFQQLNLTHNQFFITVFSSLKQVSSDYIFYIPRYQELALNYYPIIGLIWQTRKIYHRINLEFPENYDYGWNEYTRIWFMNVICQLKEDQQIQIYFHLATKYLKLIKEFEPLKYALFVRAHQLDQPQNDMLKEYFNEYTLNNQEFGFIEKEEIAKQGIQGSDLIIHRDKSKQLVYTHKKRRQSHYDQINNQDKKKNSSILSAARFDSILNIFSDKMVEQIDHEEFNKIYMQQMLSNLSRGLQLRSSIIRDQSDPVFTSNAFPSQLKRLTETMRASRTMEFQAKSTVTLSMIHLKSSFIGLTQITRQATNSLFNQYFLSYFPRKYRKTIQQFLQILQFLPFQHFLTRDYQKWLNFALIPVSYFKVNLLENKSALPISVDPQTLSFYDHLLIVKYIKPQALQFTVDVLFGQTILKEIHYGGKHNLSFLQTQQKPIWIEYEGFLHEALYEMKDILNSFKIIFCGIQNIVDIISEFSGDNIVIINPSQLQVDLELLENTIIQNLTKLKKLIIIENNKTILIHLRKISNCVFLNNEKTFKELLSTYFQNEIKQFIKGQSIQSSTSNNKFEDQDEEDCINLNSFVKIKQNSQDLSQQFSMKEFCQKIKYEILYNMFFYVTLRRKQIEYSQKTDTPSMPPFLAFSFYDIKQLIEHTVNFLPQSSAHPYPFLLKYFCMLHNIDVEDYISRQIIFHSIKSPSRLYYHQKMDFYLNQFIFINSKNEKGYLIKYNKKQLPRTNFIKSFIIQSFLSAIPENELLDLMGFPYCSEGEIEFKKSKSFIEQLNEYEELNQKSKMIKHIKRKMIKANKLPAQIIDLIKKKQKNSNLLRQQYFESLSNNIKILFYQQVSQVQEELTKQLRQCEIWLRKFNINQQNIQKKQDQEMWITAKTLDLTETQRKIDITQPHELKDHLAKFIRETILSEIKQKKDIKISTKMFTKTLQEQTLKQTENVLLQYFLQDKDKQLYYKLKEGKISLQKFIIYSEVKLHNNLVKVIQQNCLHNNNNITITDQLLKDFNIDSKKLTDLLSLVHQKYQNLSQMINLEAAMVINLHIIYDPFIIIYAYLVSKSQELNIPIWQLKLKVEKNNINTQTKQDLVISGLFLSNGHINQQNDYLEDGNTFLNQLPLPPFRLKVVSCNNTCNEIICEMVDKIHQNLEEEHQKQMKEFLVEKDVDFTKFLNRKADSPRTSVMKNLKSQKQQSENKKIYFVQIPLKLKGKNEIQIKFYMKSLLPQYNWVQKHTFIHN